MKKLTNEEALKALKKGHKIRRNHWFEGEYLVMERFIILDENKEIFKTDFVLNHENFAYWEIIPEEKERGCRNGLMHVSCDKHEILYSQDQCPLCVMEVEEK